MLKQKGKLMNMMHRTMAVVAITLALVTRLFAETETVNGITWTYTVSNGEVSLGGGGSSSPAISTSTFGAITIPSAIGGKPVTSIGPYAFYKCNGITSVTIPSNVTSIGRVAFYECNNLTNVTIGSGVTSIGDAAFYYCRALTAVTIPASIMHIENLAFDGTPFYNNQPNGLVILGKVVYKIKGSCPANITIPDGVTSISQMAFEYCKGLESITIPDSVTDIGSYAFKDCTSLTSVTIGSGLTNITNAFGQSGVEQFTVSENNINYRAVNGLLLSKDAKKLVAGINGEVTIPDSVTSIGDYAFLGRSGLTSITIPDSVTSIGDFSFSICSGLTSMTIGNGVTNIGAYAFQYCNGLTSIIIPDGVTSIGDYAYRNCTNLTSLAIGSGVTDIGHYAFDGCKGLTTVHIADIAAWCKISLGNASDPLSYAHDLYFGNSLLTDLVIPDGVTSIRAYAFRNCGNLTSVTIPNSVTNIGERAFEYCSGLTNVVISGNVTSIGSSAFSGCSRLVDADGFVILGGTLYGYFGESPEIVIPDCVTRINPDAFYDCRGLTSVTIPNSVTNIGERAFEFCTGLKSISIPDGVTRIAPDTFYGCSGLRSVTIPNSVTSIGDGAFDYSGLTSVMIPASVTNIGQAAFHYCSGIKDVMVSQYVLDQGIGNVFWGAAITNVSYSSTITHIGASAFSGCGSLTDLNIPSGVTNVASRTFSYLTAVTSLTLQGDVFLGVEDLPWNKLERVYYSLPYADNWMPYFKKYNVKELLPIEPISSTTIGGNTWQYYVDNGGAIICSGGYGAAVSPVSDGELSIPETLGGYPVVEIGCSAFAELGNVTKINIPDTVTNIAAYAFFECDALTEVVIPASVKAIGNYVFAYCENLTKVTFATPSSLTRIGDWAFYGCESMDVESFELPKPETDIEIGRSALQFFVPKLLSGTIQKSTELKRGAVYVVSNSVTVANGATLTIKPGTVIKFASGCSLTVNGTLDAQGTRAAPIVFTSLKDDEHGGDTNGDDNKTYAQAGDWVYITGSGSLNFQYCEVLWCSSQNNAGGLYANGGTWQFNNSTVAHCAYDCMRSYGGTFTANNSIFTDASIGAAPSGGSVVFNNCVFYGLQTAVRWGSGNFYNCIFSLITKDILDPSMSGAASQFRNCCFWSPEASGDKAGSKIGRNGNIWDDPLFVDAANGDFRIAVNSPCVDAGDGTVAPEMDFYGRPRMDVEQVKDTGKPNTDGVCPDIGIYEVEGIPIGAADLAVVGGRVALNVPNGGVAPGDKITLVYTITNRGDSASGTWRDTATFFNDAGAEVQVMLSATSASLPSNGPAMAVNKTLNVPALNEGDWYIRVNVNPYHDIFEQSSEDNNSGVSEGTILVALPSASLSETFSGTLARGVPVVGKFTAPTDHSYALEITMPAGATVSYGIGAMPSTGGSRSVATVNSGIAYVSIPAGETVYVEVSGDGQGVVTMRPFEVGLAVQTVSPATLPQSGEVTLKVAGLHFESGCTVSLKESGKNALVASESVRVESSESLTAKFDCSKLAAGTTYDLVVATTTSSSQAAETAALHNAVTVSGVKGAPKLEAKLDMPGSLRQGRSFVFYIDYANTGNIDMPAPIFTVKSDAMIFTTDYGVYTNSVKVIGLGAEGSVGVLKPGESFRMAVKAQIKTTASSRTSVHYSFSSSWVGANGAEGKLPLASFFSEDWTYWHGEDEQEEFDAIAAKMGATWGDFYRNFGGYITDMGAYGLATPDYEQMSQSFAWHCVTETKETTESSIVPSPMRQVSTAKPKLSKRLLGNALDEDGEEPLDHNALENRKGDWSAASSTKELSERIQRHNTILAQDNSIQGDIWVWSGTRWYRLIRPDGTVSKYFKKEADSVLICHGNLHSVHSPWVIEMATAWKTKEKGNNILAIDWGDSATAKYGENIAWLKLQEQASEPWFDAKYAHRRFTLSPIDGYTLLFSTQAGTEMQNPERAFATAIAIPAVAARGYSILTNAVDTPAKLTIIGHSHGSHVAGTIAGHFARHFGKVRRLIGLETSNLTSHLLVPNDLKYPNAWSNSSAEISEFYKTSYWMSFGAFGGDDDQVWANYNFMLVGIIDGTTKEVKSDYFEHQWLVGLGDAGNWRHALAQFLRYTDANNNEGRFGAKRHDTVQEWFIDTINNDREWGNLGYNWSGESSADSFNMLNAGMKAKLCDYVHQYHGVINIKEKRLELAQPKDWGDGEWRYEEQVLKGADGQFLNTPPLDILQDNVTQAIEYGIPDESVTIPDEIDEKNHTISFTVTNAADNLSINYNDVNKKWMASRNEAHAPWQQGIGIGVWLCRKDGGEVPADVKTIKQLRDDGGYQFQRIKNWKIESLERFTQPLQRNVRQFSLNVSQFRGESINKDGEDFLLVIGAGVSSKGNDKAVPQDYFGDLCQTNNWYIKKIKVKPTQSAVIVINGNEYEDDDTANILIAEDQTSVPLSVSAQSSIEEVCNHDWESKDGKFSSKDSQYTTWTLSFPVDKDSMETELVLTRSITSRESNTTLMLNPVSVRVRLVRKPKEPTGEPSGDGISYVPQSCDPNEMVGPEGVGEARYVKPGEWMTYTVFFENKAGAKAPAQFVTVDNPLSPYLDWSTFEMGDVGFGTQIDTGLVGVKNGTSEATMEGTNLVVRSEVTLDTERGVVSWFMRIVSPYGDSEGWPYADDLTGFLPPNDPETHCGEGHLTYRIKVRDDAPSDVVISNSAVIVFDYNEPIETDPAWWNTVATIHEVPIEIDGVTTNLTLIAGKPFGDLPRPSTGPKGYKFDAWYTGVNGTGIKATPEAIVPTGNFSLYANWLNVGPVLTIDEYGVLIAVDLNGCTEVTIPDNVTKIASSAFGDCDGLTRVTIGTGVAEIETGAFDGCTNLTEIVIAEGNENLTMKDGVLYVLPRKAAVFILYSATSAIIEDGTEVIDSNVFSGRSRLSNIKIPNSVREIGFFGYGALPEAFQKEDGMFTCDGWIMVMDRDNPPLELDSLGNGEQPSGTLDFTRFRGIANNAFDLFMNMPFVYMRGYSFSNVYVLISSACHVGMGAFDGWKDVHIIRISTVTFNANGGEGTMVPQEFTNGVAQVLSTNMFTRTGYTFAGWATNQNGTVVYVNGQSVYVPSDVTLYAQWTANVYAVKFDANGGTGSMPDQRFTYDTPQNLTANGFTKTNHVFAGWALSANGQVVYEDGQSVTNLASNENDVVTLFAAWDALVPPVPDWPPEFWEHVGGPPIAACVYDGWLYDDAGNIQGTFQIKLGKWNDRTKTRTANVTIWTLDGTKKTTKGKSEKAMDNSVNAIYSYALTGEYHNYKIEGARNMFSSKIKNEASYASWMAAKWPVVNVAWEGGTLTTTINKKGKAKVTGNLMDGTKVTANGQLIVGREWNCVPVVYAKKGVKLAFALWLPKNGESAVVTGLADAVVGKPGSLKAGAKFHIDADAFAAAWGRATLPYLPDGVTVTGGAKWVLPKAGKVQFGKDGSVDVAKLLDNPSALKLTYKAKDGTFKGSFKAYSDVRGKPKGVTVNVTGVLIDGIGYGAATIKKVGGVSVTVE